MIKMARYRACSYASATIINAIATGKGAAFAIDLKAEAEVELMSNWDDNRIEIYTYPEEDTDLIEMCVKRILKMTNKSNKRFGVKITIRSEIPIAQGLSSSSAVSNAVVLATSKACKVNLSNEDLIKTGVDCSIESNVSITGAFDDASASFLGGITITDNIKRIILKREAFPHGYSIIVVVSDKRCYTRDVNRGRIKIIKEFVDMAFEKAINGNIFDAITMNGILYSSILKYNPEPIYEMLTNGAVAAGLSGTGPAFFGVVKKHLAKDIKKSVEQYGRVIETKPKNSGAGIFVF